MAITKNTNAGYLLVHEEPSFIRNVQIKWLIVKFDVELKEQATFVNQI